MKFNVKIILIIYWICMHILWKIFLNIKKIKYILNISNIYINKISKENE